MAPGQCSPLLVLWLQGGCWGVGGRVKSGRLQPAALAPVIPPESRTGRTRSPFCSQELIAKSHLGCHSSPDQLPEECEGERSREHGPRPRHQSQGRSSSAGNQRYQQAFGWWDLSSPSPQPPCPLCPLEGLTLTPVLRGLPPAPKLVPCYPSLHPRGKRCPNMSTPLPPSAEPGGMGQATRHQHNPTALTVDMNSSTHPLSRARPSPPACDGCGVCPPKQACPWRGSPVSSQAWPGTWKVAQGATKFSAEAFIAASSCPD